MNQPHKIRCRFFRNGKVEGNPNGVYLEVVPRQGDQVHLLDQDQPWGNPGAGNVIGDVQMVAWNRSHPDAQLEVNIFLKG